MKNSVFPFFCYAESRESKKDAWEKFNKEFEHHLSYIKGYKYWRSIPRAGVDRDYMSDEITYHVTSRIYASLDPLDGHSPVELDKPFPTKLENKYENDETLMSFKLENGGSKR